MARAVSPGKLHLGSRDDPRVSVVVVAWRDAPHLIRCLEHLSESRTVPLEVLVALNEPTDGLSDVVRRRLAGATVRRSSVNLGFAAACNGLAERARGDYLLLLNDDALLAPTTLAALVRTLDEDGGVAAVGSKFLYPDGQLQEAGAVIWSDGSVFQVSHLVGPEASVVEEPRTVDYCSGAGLLVRRDAWNEVGGMDEGYFPAYYEDVDLCMKLKARRGRILYQPEAEITHVMGASASLRYREYLVERNRRRFVERWSDALRSFPPRPDPFHAAAVLEAVEHARRAPDAHRPGRVPPPSPPVPKAAREVLGNELGVQRAFGQQLEELLDRQAARLSAVEEELGRLHAELAAARVEGEQHARVVAELLQSIEVRDRFLAQDQLQLEDLARQRAAAVEQLEAVLARPSYQLVERLAEEVRTVPGARAVVKRLLGTAAH